MNEITSTEEMAEDEWDGCSEPGEVNESISATDVPDPDAAIEFYVQMRRYTQHAMEDLIVEAAARQIIGRHNDHDLAKRIEDKCIELLNEKATAALATVTDDIIDQPLTPNIGDKEPVTMREFIGLYAREYLEAKVDREGKPSKGGWSSGAVSNRMEWLVSRTLDRKFKNEIEKATNALITEMRAAMKAQHDALIAKEKARIRDALARAAE